MSGARGGSGRTSTDTALPEQVPKHKPMLTTGACMRGATDPEDMGGTGLDL